MTPPPAAFRWAALFFFAALCLLFLRDTFYTPALAANDVHASLATYVVSASASSVEDEIYPAEFAFDGSMETRWVSAHNDGEHIEAVFSDQLAIKEVTIHWDVARASSYTLLARTKQGKWVRLLTRSDVAGGVDVITFNSPIRMGGVRLQCDARASEFGSSVREIEFTGTASAEPPEQSLVGWDPPFSMEDAVLEQEPFDEPPPAVTQDQPALSDEELLDLVQRRAFDYFWNETNPKNGLTKDRAKNFVDNDYTPHASIAASGFALSAYVIGVERGWITKKEAYDRTSTTLKTFLNGPVRHVEGFFPHFVDYYTGEDAPGTELSTIDTVLLLAGMVTAMEYFDDIHISSLSRQIFDRVDWNWARNGNKYFVSHGLDEDGDFLSSYWGSMTEGLIIYLLGLGSSAHRLPSSTWKSIDRHWGEYAGYRFVCEYGFQSMFRYQYPALWYDLRGRTDQQSGADFFENATLATLAMREYALREASTFPKSFNKDMWGLSAADGLDGKYMIYGFPPGRPDALSAPDGTIVVYAMLGCMPFLPQHVMRAIRYLYDNHPDAWGKYGFTDSINPGKDFMASDVIGIDVGTILIAIENYRTELIWKLFMKSRWIHSTNDKIQWKRKPHSRQVQGSVDLARDYLWRFKEGDGEYHAVDFDDSAWREVVVPEYWERIDPKLDSLTGYGWYRVSFDLSQARLAKWRTSGRPFSLRIGGIANSDVTYINGKKIGETTTRRADQKGPRNYKINGRLLRAGKNTVAIRVMDVGDQGGIWSTPVELGPVY